MQENARVMKYREALNEALQEEMRRDPTVFLMGEGIAERGGSYKVTAGLLEEFGPERVRDTPIAEASFVGAGVGAAITGGEVTVHDCVPDHLRMELRKLADAGCEWDAGDDWVRVRGPERALLPPSPGSGIPGARRRGHRPGIPGRDSSPSGSRRRRSGG